MTFTYNFWWRHIYIKSPIMSVSHILGPPGPIISFPHNFTKKYFFQKFDLFLKHPAVVWKTYNCTVFLKNITTSKTMRKEVLPQIWCGTVIGCFNVGKLFTYVPGHVGNPKCLMRICEQKTKEWLCLRLLCYSLPVFCVNGNIQAETYIAHCRCSRVGQIAEA